MSVLEALLDQADEVLSGVADLTRENLQATARSDLDIDLNRIFETVPRLPLGSLDLDALAGLKQRKWRLRARLRARLPVPSAVTRAHTFMEASLVGAVDGDIRAVLTRMEAIGREDVDGLSARCHPAVVAAFEAWRADLEGLQLSRGSIDRALAVLLLARCVVHGSESQSEDVLELLSGTHELSGPIARATELLEMRLDPVYYEAGRLMSSMVAEMVSSEDAIYRARTSLSAVAARSSLANA